MVIEQIEDKARLRELVRVLKEDSDKVGKKILSELDMLFWRGVPVWIGLLDDSPVTINATYFGKKKTHIWEPYANGYTAFTRVQERRKGHARELNTHIRELAVAAGCRRYKALAGTKLGYYFHRAFGDQIWGLNDRRMLLVDTPLVDPAIFPANTTPRNVKKWTTRTSPMSESEIDAVLQESLFYEEV